MISPSYERSSLVRDRCTTCGSLLPCVLHDREMRRGILNVERDGPPGYEKVWVVGARLEGAGFFNVCGQRGVLGIEKDHRTPILFQPEQIENSKFEFRRLHDRRGYEVRFPKEVKTLGKYRDGFLALSDDLKKVMLLERGSDTQDVWVIRQARLEITANSKFNHLELIDEQSSGEFLVRGNTSTTHELLLLQPPVNGEDNWRLAPIWDASVERNFVAETYDDSYSSLKQIIPFFDGTYLAGDKLGDLQGVMPSKHVRSAVWTKRWFRWPDALQPSFDGNPFNRGVLWTKLSADELLLGDKANGLFLICRRPNGKKTIKRLPLPVWKHCTETTGTISSEVVRLSNDSFIITAFNLLSGLTGMTSSLEIVKRTLDGAWVEEMIFDGSEGMVGQLIPLATEPPSFVCVHLIDGTATYWRIPPVKLRAYHERKAAQIKTPPLPPDL